MTGDHETTGDDASGDDRGAHAERADGRNGVRTDGGATVGPDDAIGVDEYDDRPLRERLSATPRPALVWLAGTLVLLALEFGRIAGGLLRLGGMARTVLGGLVVVPGWIGGNVAGTLGGAAGTVAFLLAALLGLFLLGVVVKALLVPWSLVGRLGLREHPPARRSEAAEAVVERAIVGALVGLVVVALAATPLAGAVDALAGAIGRALAPLAELPTLTGRETISNQGHQAPGGGWTGTFLGLSPAWAWALRVAVVYLYAFVWFGWLWKGYDVFREHYREADWTPRDDAIDRFRAHYWGIFGLAIVFAFVVMAIWAPALGPVPAEHNVYSPYEHEFEYLDGESVETISHGAANVQTRSQGGASNVGPLSYDQYGRWHPIGTNQDGKDLFTMVVFGARVSLLIGVTAIGLGTFIALALSMITAYYKGLADLLTIVTTDTIIAIPAFLLVLLLSVVFQEANHPLAEQYDGALLLALIYAGIYWPFLWRSIRGPSLQVAEQEWVDAAKSFGQTPIATMRKHMAPFVFSYVMIYASLLLGSIIIVTAALSFLGLGITSPTPEWGRIVDEGQSYVPTASWHISTIPGIMVVLVVTGFNALGDGIRDAVDPESSIGAGGETEAAAAGGGG